MSCYKHIITKGVEGDTWYCQHCPQEFIPKPETCCCKEADDVCWAEKTEGGKCSCACHDKKCCSCYPGMVTLAHCKCPCHHHKKSLSETHTVDPTPDDTYYAGEVCVQNKKCEHSQPCDRMSCHLKTCSHSCIQCGATWCPSCEGYTKAELDDKLYNAKVTCDNALYTARREEREFRQDLLNYLETNACSGSFAQGWIDKLRKRFLS